MKSVLHDLWPRIAAVLLVIGLLFSGLLCLALVGWGVLMVLTEPPQPITANGWQIALAVLLAYFLGWWSGKHYHAEKEARQRQRDARRARKRERRAETRRFLLIQRRYKMAILHAHPWHTTIVLTLLGIAGVLIWSVPPKAHPNAEPAWQAWPVAIIALTLLVYLWRFEALTKEDKIDPPQA
jgi:hypothetical protein